MNTLVKRSKIVGFIAILIATVFFICKNGLLSYVILLPLVLIGIVVVTNFEKRDYKKRIAVWIRIVVSTIWAIVSLYVLYDCNSALATSGSVIGNGTLQWHIMPLSSIVVAICGVTALQLAPIFIKSKKNLHLFNQAIVCTIILSFILYFDAFDNERAIYLLLQLGGVVIVGLMANTITGELLDRRFVRATIMALSVCLLSMIVCFPVMSFQLSSISNIDTDSPNFTVKYMDRSPDTLYTVFRCGVSGSHNDVIIITRDSSHRPIYINSTYTITPMFGDQYNYYNYTWYETGFSLNRYSDDAIISLPPTLWDRLRTWIILQKYPELSNPEFLNSARESVEE